MVTAPDRDKAPDPDKGITRVAGEDFGVPGIGPELAAQKEGQTFAVPA